MTRSRLLSALIALPVSASIAFAEEYPRFRKAQESFDQEIYLGAVAEARSQLRETPSHAPSWLLIARSYLKLGKCSEAGSAAASAFGVIGTAGPSVGLRSDLDKVFSELDAQCGGSVEVGRAYVQTKDYEKAAEYYRNYLQKNPSDLDARLDYAKILSWIKSYGAAADQFKRYLDSRPGEVPAILGLADVYAWSGEHKLAEAQLKRVLAKEHGNSDAVVKLALVYEWQGKYDAAKAEFQRASRLAPMDQNAREGLERVTELSATRRKTTPVNEIIDELHKTGDRTILMKLGDAYYHNEGKIDDAFGAYRRYLKEFPDDPKAQLKLARMLGWEKRYGESAELFNAYLAKNPDDAAVRLELAELLAWQGRHVEALAELDRVKNLQGASPAPYLSAGDVHRWRGDYPDAVDNYRKALELDAENARARAGLAAVDAVWSPRPAAGVVSEGVAMDDIDFGRHSHEAGGRIALWGGRIELMPGVRAHFFEQSTSTLDAGEAFVNFSFPLQDKWRWWGGLGVIKFGDRSERLQGAVGIEGTVSTHTWIKLGYVGQDAVFETNNLSALLSDEKLKLDSYNFEFARSLRGGNEVSGLISGGYLTDTNSRARVFVRAMHRISELPAVRVGAVYKALSFARTSSHYWSPSSYVGTGAAAELRRSWKDFTCKAGLTIYRISQISSTETLVEGSASYRPRGPWQGEAAIAFGRGAGASSSGTHNTAYRMAQLKAGYRF